jgi:hypothetical protein
MGASLFFPAIRQLGLLEAALSSRADGGGLGHARNPAGEWGMRFRAEQIGGDSLSLWARRAAGEGLVAVGLAVWSAA